LDSSATRVKATKRPLSTVRPTRYDSNITMKFALSPVEPSDMDEIIRLQFLCFGATDMHVVFFGHCEPAKVEAKKRHLHDLATDPCNMWLKIVNMDTDKMVSASNWCISPTRVEKDEPIKVDWLEDPEEIKSAEEVLEDYMGRRKKHMTQPHVLLNILFTDRHIKDKEPEPSIAGGAQI
jgi:hypothetical protein